MVIGLIVVGVIVVACVLLWIVSYFWGKKFDKEWKDLTPEERFELQNDARKRQI